MWGWFLIPIPRGTTDDWPVVIPECGTRTDLNAMLGMG